MPEELYTLEELTPMLRKYFDEVIHPIASPEGVTFSELPAFPCVWYNSTTEAGFRQVQIQIRWAKTQEIVDSIVDKIHDYVQGTIVHIYTYNFPYGMASVRPNNLKNNCIRIIYRSRSYTQNKV